MKVSEEILFKRCQCLSNYSKERAITSFQQLLKQCLSILKPSKEIQDIAGDIKIEKPSLHFLEIIKLFEFCHIPCSK